MNPEETTIFEAAGKLSDPAKRTAFPDAAWADRAGLRPQMDEPLDAMTGADKVLEAGVAPSRKVAPPGLQL
jgi:hypothetical protein